METSQIDYQIQLQDVRFLNTLRRTEHVNVYTALWRHQMVCVKEIVEPSRSVEREISILTKCIHPKIVQFLGYSDKYILFEYMEHGDLRDYMAVRRNVLVAFDRLRMMRDIAVGLHYLHNRTPCGIFHRDLKPDNILVNRHGDVKIADFDVSKMVLSDETTKYKGHTGETGTYLWIAPEVLQHRQYNYTADIYSLGLVFYYIWTSKIPFEHLRMSPIQLAFAKINNTVEIPTVQDNPFLNSIVAQCCAYDPVDRPNTANIIGMLDHVISHLKEARA